MSSISTVALREGVAGHASKMVLAVFLTGCGIEPAEDAVMVEVPEFDLIVGVQPGHTVWVDEGVLFAGIRPVETETEANPMAWIRGMVAGQRESNGAEESVAEPSGSAPLTLHQLTDILGSRCAPVRRLGRVDYSVRLGGTSPADCRSRRLGSELRICYRVQREDDYRCGSEVLEGLLTVGTETFTLRCARYGEDGDSTLEARSCLPYLATFERLGTGT